MMFRIEMLKPQRPRCRITDNPFEKVGAPQALGPITACTTLILVSHDPFQTGPEEGYEAVTASGFNWEKANAQLWLNRRFNRRDRDVDGIASRRGGDHARRRPDY